MKAKVIKSYKDKQTKKINTTGEVIEISKKRFEEINSTQYGIFLEEIQEDNPIKK